MPVTDCHIHVMPWWEMKPAAFEVMTRGRTDLDELQKIMKSPTDLTLILAHGGRPLWMEQAFFLVRRFPQVYMDVSSIPPKAILRYFPRLAEVADKVLYGSDWPSPGVTSMAQNLSVFRALGVPGDLLDKMLDTNAREVFG